MMIFHLNEDLISFDKPWLAQCRWLGLTRGQNPNLKVSDQSLGDDKTMMMMMYHFNQDKAQPSLRNHETLIWITNPQMISDQFNETLACTLTSLSSDQDLGGWLAQCSHMLWKHAMPNDLTNDMQYAQASPKRGGQILRCYSCPYSIHCEPVDLNSLGFQMIRMKSDWIPRTDEQFALWWENN